MSLEPSRPAQVAPTSQVERPVTWTAVGLVSSAPPKGLNSFKKVKVSGTSSASTSEAKVSGTFEGTLETSSTKGTDLENSMGVAETAPESEPSPGPGAEAAVDIAALHNRLALAAVDCYPASARKFRQAGTATLHFCVSERGTPTGASLTASSGFSNLDSAVLDCVVPRATGLPLLAAGQCFDVPIRFGARSSQLE